MVEKEKIVIFKYDPQWPEHFSKLSIHLKQVLGDLVKEIQHVGSTAVPGLNAKPIIDIDIILKDLAFLDQAIESLEKRGYKYLGEMGISGRFAFQAPKSMISDDIIDLDFATHNTYICDPSSEAYFNHIHLRDHLRLNAEDRQFYSQLKEKLATLYPYEIDKYVEGKTDFILSVLEKKGLDQHSINKIRKEN